jgi:hypothetical protein
MLQTSLALQLHDVQDAERFVSAIASKSGLTLSYHEREDLEQWLLGECWRLSLRYSPGRGSTTSFAGWATTTLRLRVTDWIRAKEGRTTWKFKEHTHTRERPTFIPLDYDDSDRDRLGGSVATDDGNPAAGWDEAGRGLLAERDLRRARDLAALADPASW